MWSVCAIRFLPDTPTSELTVEYAKEEGQMMRRTILLVATMALTLLVASGVAMRSPRSEAPVPTL